MLEWLEKFIKNLPENCLIMGIEVSAYDKELYYCKETGYIYSRESGEGCSECKCF